jgi:hypothetical protein
MAFGPGSGLDAYEIVRPLGGMKGLEGQDAARKV